MRKMFKLAFVTVVAAMSMFVASAGVALAADTVTVTVGNSNVTIKADRDMHYGVFLPNDTNAGVDVTFQITSDNSPITAVRVYNDIEEYNSNSVTFTHEYTDMRQDMNVMEITLADGSEEGFYNVPVVLPASYTQSDIAVKTDPTGLSISANGLKSRNGSEYMVAVYKDAAHTKFINSYICKTEGGAYAITKKKNSWYKPNTKYCLAIYPQQYYTFNGQETTMRGKPTYRTIQTSPTVNPVIKSVKVSNVKVKKYFDYATWKYRYTTTYKLTITLSKKASNTKGVIVKASRGEYTAKGTGKVFTISCRSDSGVSYAGTKQQVKLMTYNASAANGYALSSATKNRTYKVKNGTY